MSSSFDRKTCCLCMRSACHRMSLYTALAILNMCIVTTSIALNLIYLCNNNKDVLIAGVALHVLSFLLELTMGTYPFRYWTGMEGTSAVDRKREYSNDCCGARFGIYAGKTYFILLMYLIAIIACLGNAASEAGTDENWTKHKQQVIADATRMSLGALAYFVSFVIVLLWTLIRKPTCTDRRDEAGLFYHDDESVNIDTGASSAILFLVSYVVLNGSFGVYYVSPSYIYYLLPGTAAVSLVIAASIATAIACTKGCNQTSPGSVLWGTIIFAVAATAIGCFIYALAAFGVDPDFKVQTTVQWVSFLVQGAIPLLFAACFIIYLIVIAIIFCGTCCCDNIKESVAEAEQRVVYERSPLVMNDADAK